MFLSLHDAAELRDPTGPVRVGAGLGIEAVQILVQQGVLRQVLGDVYLPWDSWEVPLHRASALAQFLPPAPRDTGETQIACATVTSAAAAWVWGGPLPDLLTVAHQRGGVRPNHPLVQTRQCETIEADEVTLFEWVTLGRRLGVEVTSPVRSAMDLALHPEDGDEALQWLLAVLVEPEDVLAALERRVSNVVAARRRVTQLSP